MSNPDSSASIKDYTSSVLLANENWAKRLNQTFPHYFPDPLDKQAPKLLWIGCSDSRIQESDTTTALPGTVFVHRNIANQFYLKDDSALSVFAYAIKVLGVQHIAVVGHEHCGGAITAMKEAHRPPYEDQLEHHHTVCDSLHHFVKSNRLNDVHDRNSKDPNDAITRWLTPLVHRVRQIKSSLPSDEEKALQIVIEENVKMQVDNVAKLDEWVCGQVEKRPVYVHGWVHDFSTGFIRDLKITKELGA
jgi:carbonic anhydrase